MKDKFKNLITKFDTLKAQRDLSISQLEIQEETLKVTTNTLADTESVRVLFQNAAQITQQNLKLHITEIVDLALNLIDDPPKFVIDIVQRRNKTEVDLLFERGNKTTSPIGSSSGGSLNLAAFALRIAMWSINKNRPLVILDEPFHFLSAKYQIAASKLFTVLHQRLKIQFLIISHKKDTIHYADKVFKTVRKNKISYVTG